LWRTTGQSIAPKKACPGLDPGWEPVFGGSDAQQQSQANIRFRRFDVGAAAKSAENSENPPQSRRNAYFKFFRSSPRKRGPRAGFPLSRE
jgi:hypothetical protein